MIHHVYFQGMSTNYLLNAHSYNVDDKTKKMHGKNIQTLLADQIKKRPQDHWIFIVTKDQKHTFDNWLTSNELADTIKFKMDKPVINGNYMEQGPKLFLYVLQAKETQ